jgi:DNA-binding NarL/FixJ family response regulator
MPVRILFADDHKLFTDGLQFLLGTYGIKVIGVAENGFEAVQKAETLKPDIVLMDIMMPGCNGIEALKRIKARMPDVKIVMLTTSEDDEDLFQAIRLGASGYLLKSLNGEELVKMLTDLENGGAPVSPKLAARLLKEFRRSGASNNSFVSRMDTGMNINLTERQAEVLEAVAKGATYKEIGELLHITERTVKYHMCTIMEQLQMKNKTQVIAYAAKMGWTDNKK